MNRLEELLEKMVYHEIGTTEERDAIYTAVVACSKVWNNPDEPYTIADCGNWSLLDKAATMCGFE